MSSGKNKKILEAEKEAFIKAVGICNGIRDSFNKDNLTEGGDAVNACIFKISKEIEKINTYDSRRKT